jgi:predicted transcriptional regulator YheO
MITDFCVICGTKENLHNHHIVCKKSKLKPISGDIDHYTNLITLCGEHHGWIHGMKPNRFNDNNRLRMAGIKKAQKEGRMGGRKPTIDVHKVIELHSQGKSAIYIAKELGIGRASVYRYLPPKPKQMTDQAQFFD